MYLISESALRRSEEYYILVLKIDLENTYIVGQIIHHLKEHIKLPRSTTMGPYMFVNNLT